MCRGTPGRPRASSFSVFLRNEGARGCSPVLIWLEWIIFGFYSRPVIPSNCLRGCSCVQVIQRNKQTHENQLQRAATAAAGSLRRSRCALKTCRCQSRRRLNVTLSLCCTSTIKTHVRNFTHIRKPARIQLQFSVNEIISITWPVYSSRQLKTYKLH